ncbi:hypothetical protein, partial [Chromobacterium piscinae]|uniref:hypothetical protein n=1 Tax=Chromobacterium piscinae TaxID=686831 RepID=UPI003260DD7D
CGFYWSELLLMNSAWHFCSTWFFMSAQELNAGFALSGGEALCARCLLFKQPWPMAWEAGAFWPRQRAGGRAMPAVAGRRCGVTVIKNSLY